ncbi:MAG: hypothetical protein ACFFA4_05275 [Promethearchaeota archaeon]
MTGFFQIDWISVDIIIIILLLLLLFSVKLFKITHRWRYSFSNQVLEHICFSKTREKKTKSIISIKKWCLTRNSNLKNNFSVLPLILILRTNHRKKLLRVFTEGLSTYGFNVINIKAKINHKTANKMLENTLLEEWKSLITTIVGDFKIMTSMAKLQYVLINYSGSVIYCKQFLSDSNIGGVIMINPKLNKRKFSDYDIIFSKDSIKAQIFPIFSGKSTLVSKNKHLKKFLEGVPHQKQNYLEYLAIEKATFSFKYYETIVISMIIEIVENKLLKSEL